MSKLLIVGNGFLGNAIYEETKKQKLESKVSDYHENGIDVTKINTIERVFEREKPEIVINCSAISNVDEIESNSENALNVNSYGSKNLAISCKKYHSKLIHISTDSVFDGKRGMYTENDITNPINEYSKSKKLAENWIIESLENHIIVRTNFYGKNKKGEKLFDWIIQNLERKSKIIGFSDIIFNPLEINNLSKMILELSRVDFNGTIHLSNNEVFSKFDFCKKIANVLGFSENLIEKGTINNSKLLAKRPQNTTLSNKLSTKILNTKPILLTDYLNEFKKYRYTKTKI